MKQFPRRTLLLLLLCIFLLLLGTGAAYAGVTAAEIPWWTVDGGGGRSTSTHLVLNGSIGQFDAGSMSSSHTYLYGGYWVPGGEPGETIYRVFLPLTTKQ